MERRLHGRDGREDRDGRDGSPGRVEDDRPSKRSRGAQDHGEDRPDDRHAAAGGRDDRHDEGRKARSVHDRLGVRVPEDQDTGAGDAAAAAAGWGAAGGRVQRVPSRSERAPGKFGVWGGILQKTLQDTNTQPSTRKSRWDRK
jgi:hypothetical protein